MPFTCEHCGNGRAEVYHPDDGETQFCCTIWMEDNCYDCGVEMTPNNIGQYFHKGGMVVVSCIPCHTEWEYYKFLGNDPYTFVRKAR